MRCSMRYDLGSGIVIKSENAAKPATQPSAFLDALIRKLEPVERSFDYGCGKLRYRVCISETTDSLAVVDSEIQLSRTQIIGKRNTSIRAVARLSNRLHAYNVDEF